MDEAGIEVRDEVLVELNGVLSGSGTGSGMIDVDDCVVDEIELFVFGVTVTVTDLVAKIVEVVKLELFLELEDDEVAFMVDAEDGRVVVDEGEGSPRIWKSTEYWYKSEFITESNISQVPGQESKEFSEGIIQS